MTEEVDQLKKLATIATDLELTSDLRNRAVEQIGRTGTHEALLVLLDIVANEHMVREERENALKQARVILRSGRK